MTLLSSSVVSLSPPRLLRFLARGRAAVGRFWVGRFALCIGPRGGAGNAKWIQRLGYQSGWGCGIANQAEAGVIVRSCWVCDHPSCQGRPGVRLADRCSRTAEGSSMNLRWTVAVLLGLAVGCSHHDKGEAKEGDEGNEVKMTLDQVPAPVRATLMREAGGATIKSVDKEESKGQVIYETDVMVNGKNWELRVDPDGKLISKKLDNEEAEKGEKAEKK